ncbi:hypothetical protein BC828DRAFT_416438 [Blastocladiella britannica]|nr:hypothetical protein BC828DRAFT_416438 [Blastocladiella britannica]
MAAINISRVLDRILLFASHKSYTLAVGLDLLSAASTSGSVGRLDLLEHLADKFIGHIAHSAVVVNHAHVLDWLPLLDPKFLARTLHNIVYLVAMHGRIGVLDWCFAHGTDIRTGLKDPFNVATQYCQLDSLKWLKTYSVEHGLDYVFRAIHREIGLKFVSGE